jgi:hypothetical protein
MVYLSFGGQIACRPRTNRASKDIYILFFYFFGIDDIVKKVKCIFFDGVGNAIRFFVVIATICWILNGVHGKACLILKWEQEITASANILRVPMKIDNNFIGLSSFHLQVGNFGAIRVLVELTNSNILRTSIF